MNILEALVLGVVQGLTEFLPVSSSGHLEIVKYLIGDDVTASQSMFMTVLLHFATALSTMVYFRKSIVSVLVNREIQYIGFIILSMIPAVFVGLMFDDIIESFFSQKIVLVAGMLLITGLLLLFADHHKKTDESITAGKALLIGVAQAIAILPGISRSGATIASSLLLNVDRAEAARFSFLMVIPLIFGKMAKDLISSDIVLAHPTSYYSVGFVSAFVAGLFACGLMVNIVKRAKLRYFSYYCFVVGVVIIGLYLFN